MSDAPPSPSGFPPPPPGFGTPPPPPGFGAPPPPGYAAYREGSASQGVPTAYAGFWPRFAALLIDSFIVGLFAIPAVVAIVAGPTRITGCHIDRSGDVTGFSDRANGLCRVPTGGTIAVGVLLGLVAIAGALLYYGMLEGGPNGQALGKKALGIKVVDGTTGGPIGGGRAIGRRLFAIIISAQICYLGYLWMLWDDRSQCWHDKVTSAVVIKAQ